MVSLGLVYNLAYTQSMAEGSLTDPGLASMPPQRRVPGFETFSEYSHSQILDRPPPSQVVPMATEKLKLFEVTGSRQEHL